MLYITGEKDTLKDLIGNDEGDNYRSFFKSNNHLPSGSGRDHPLPRFTPVLLNANPHQDQMESVKEISAFTESERQNLRQMQESGYDFLTQIAMQEIMEDLQHYAKEFRKYYDSPLINTPWKLCDQTLTNASGVDLFSEMSIYSARTLRTSSRVLYFDALHENLLQRDVLNRELLMMKGTTRSAVHSRISHEKKIQELTREIKRALNSKIDTKVAKFLSSFGNEELRKMRCGSYSTKLAKKNQTISSKLDLLNKSGVTALKKYASALNVIGEHSGKISTCLAVGAVAYDVGSAYYRGDSISRAFLTGTAGIATSFAMASASASLASLGATTISTALVIGGVAGEASLAVGVLLCTPAGVVVLTVAGLAATGYASYKASEFVGELWDQREEISQLVSGAADAVYQKITNAWRSLSPWILDFYGSQDMARPAIF